MSKTDHELEIERILFRVCTWLGFIWGTLVAGFMILYLVIAMTAKA